MAKAIYGYVNGETVELVTMRVALDGLSMEDDFWLAGREICRRPSRDYEVRLGSGVIVEAGGFPSSAGSMKHPQLSPNKGTVLEVRDIPKALAEAAKTKHPDAISIFVPAIPEEQAATKFKKLVERKKELEEELSFVNSQLALLAEINQLPGE